MTTVLVSAPTARAGAELARLLGSRTGLRVLVAPPEIPLAEPVSDLRPDVLVVDAGTRSAGDVLSELRTARVAAVVVLGGAELSGLLGEAGVRGVLPRTASPRAIAAAIDAVAAGLVAFHPDTARTTRHQVAGAVHAEQPLTPRELEVLGMMAEGLGNKRIAARLAISEHTVKFHAAAIFAKLGAAGRTEAVAIGVRRGLILI